MSFLLDANALIALCWQPHEHHDRMRNWFKRHADQGWSTCALTQGALVRIVSQPAFAGRALAIADVAELLLRNTAHPKHRLLALDFDFAQVMAACTGNLVGHRQITDGWLLAAAMRNSVKLLTFDTAISALLATEAERQAHLATP
jgi:uncharacterized protein